MDQMLALARAAGVAAAVRRTGSVWLAATDEVELVESAIGAMSRSRLPLPDRPHGGARADAAVVSAWRPWLMPTGSCCPAEWVRALAAAAAGARRGDLRADACDRARTRRGRLGVGLAGGRTAHCRSGGDRLRWFDPGARARTRAGRLPGSGPGAGDRAARRHGDHAADATPTMGTSTTAPHPIRASRSAAADSPISMLSTRRWNRPRRRCRPRSSSS